MAKILISETSQKKYTLKELNEIFKMLEKINNLVKADNYLNKKPADELYELWVNYLNENDLEYDYGLFFCIRVNKY